MADCPWGHTKKQGGERDQHCQEQPGLGAGATEPHTPDETNCRVIPTLTEKPCSDHLPGELDGGSSLED